MGIDVPDQRRIVAGLTGTRWTRIEVVAETGSTNADLLARIDAGEDVDGTALISARQTSGRGRHARVWETPPGQLAISAALRVPSDAVVHLGWLSLLTGLAVHDAVSELAGAALELKWPNDVLAPGRGKLSGILSEFRLTSGGEPSTAGIAVIGTGLNLDLPAGSAPDTAASISSLVAGEVDQTAVAAAYLRALSERLAAWPDRIGELAASYREVSATLGSRVRLILPGDTEVIGDAVDIDDEGRIIVDGPDGRITASAGDVTHLRPAT
ncbi:biotin--[acetyl-CoA-carboxylase] ligase [Gordonia hydrophobica]|uniref:biotin--[biotin carboxyl-carrier protein] ligase n=1 Tax=Gordonia hydrophobica TaxID=40516 RepID=A0ABZ2U1L0_9ACTN|nr:biotin--[acetyl-CoA-carboxylase] ligase [Gordonia hydrophobica]MBM7366653.1 BirA family biotin operon repressor/biotin-[acetyl-CoA-carboxylase] ligase [Gordonia hydrophobica]